MPFRDAIEGISPPFLLGENGRRIQYTAGLMIDVLAQWAIEGVKASMPGIGTPTANPMNGRDMGMEQGPTEPDADFAIRLQGSVDEHRRGGSPAVLLDQIAAFLSPKQWPIRLVSNSGVWHEYDYGTGLTTKTIVGSNWNWDGLTTRWHRGWVVIDASSAEQVGMFAVPVRGTGLKRGTGQVRGGAPSARAWAQGLKRVIGSGTLGKPANVYVEHIIVIFDPTLFARTNTSPPNPDGEYGDAAQRAADAIYVGGVI